MPPTMITARLLLLVLALVAFPARAQWIALGDMPPPSRQGNALRFENAQAVAVVTALSPEIFRVRVSPGGEGRDHSYAVINRDFGDPGATFSIESSRSVISTKALRVSIQHAPFRVAFATPDGRSLDEDDPQRGTALSATGANRVWKRLRNDENVYGFGEKNGPLSKRGWKLGGYSFTMWNSDTFGYDASTDPIYVSVPFYIVLRKGVAHGIFLDNTFRSNFDIGHQTEGVLSFGAEGGPLDYYFIYGPEPKKVIERYTALTGRMPLPPLWALGYHQCRYSYYPEKKVRSIADNFRLRQIPADVIWLDIHYQDAYKPFTWDRRRFPDPARMISDLRKQGFRTVTIVDPHPAKERGYAPYDTGLAGDHFVKNPDGSIYQAPVWPSKAEDGDAPDWSKPPGVPSVFPDFSKPAARAWWGGLYADLLNAGVAGIWNDMNEPAIFDTPTGTMPLDVRHDNEDVPTDHREIHNVYGMLMTRSTYEGLLRLRPNERPFILSRASYAGGQRYSALWPGDNVSDWTALRGSIPILLGMGLSGFPFIGVDIGGFAEAPTAELYTRWLQAGVFYPFMRTHTTFGTPDQEPWSYGVEHEAINRRAIELRYQLLPHIYNVMRESAETGIPAMRPMMLEYPEDEGTYGMDDQFMFGSDLLIAPVLRAEVKQRGVYLPAGQWYDYWTGERHAGGKWITVPVTLSSIPIFVRGGSFVFGQPVVQHTGEMAGQPLEVAVFPSGTSERWLYEDAGNGFDYQRGVFARRLFAARQDASGLVIEIGIALGSYSPQPRAMLLVVRSQPDAARVSVRRQWAAAGSLIASQAKMSAEELEKSELGWSTRDGSLIIKLPDRFERVEIRIHDGAPPVPARDAQLETLFEGAVFTEGPAAAPDGTIYFSDITGSAKSREAGHIMRYDPRTRKVSVFRSPSGMANGIVFDLQGRMVIAEGADYGGRRVARTEMTTGKSERLAVVYDGKPFNSPNDLTVDARGRIYFTDPRYVGNEPIEQPVQAVYRIDPDGSVHRIISDAGKPNGIAVSPDQKTLYVAGTPNAEGQMTILAYDLAADGSAKFRDVLVHLKTGYADGLTVDRVGNVYCGCGPLGVRVFSPKGEELASIPTPAEATNVEFGRGDDKRTLYITAGRGLYRTRVENEGFHPAD